MTKRRKRESEERPPSTTYHVDTGGGAFVGGDVHAGRDFTGRDLVGRPAEGVPDLDAPDYAAARRRYLAALRRQYSFVETHAFTALAQDERAGSPRRLDLLGEQGVYVPLLFDAPAARREAGEELVKEAHLRELAERETRPLSLADVLQLPDHLAIIGDAGCGKTTVLHVIVSALAAEDVDAIAPDVAPVLPVPRPIPVFLPLRLFERACGDDDHPGAYARCARDLLRFLDDWFSDWCPDADLLPGFLADHVRSGRAWLLLDGLDEVPDPTHRETVRNVIKELAGYGRSAGSPGPAPGQGGTEMRGTRLLVTARVAAYRNTPLDDRFAVVTVRDLDETQRTHMVHAIYGGLALPDADRRASELADRFASSEVLQDLARTPVMVWTAAVIHALRGELPDSRAALYDAYVDILLKHSFKRTRFDTAAVDELVEGQGWSLEDRRHYLTYAAFKVHQLLEVHPERQGGRRVVVGEDELIDDVLVPYFQDKMYLSCIREARSRAQAFLTLMAERSGLLYESGQGYAVGDHLTMQEFLAGYYLAENYASEDPKGYRAFMEEKVNRSWWREVLLLAAGYLAKKPGFKAPKFLEEISVQGESPADQLAALALAGRGLLQLKARLRRPTWYTGLAQDFANRLYRLLYAEPAPVPAAARQEAGLVLGLLYGYPGEGDLADPRFAGSLGRPDFVPIQAGWFWMGSTEEEVERLIKETGKDYFRRELPRHRVALDAYEVARYPTTNAMFARFVGAEGYGDEHWWAEAVADGYWKEGRVKDRYTDDWHDRPRYWDDLKWNNPSQPVVGVNWYEAVAYCRWLTAMLDDGYTYRLPTEAEWERAARGPSASSGRGRRYPWGDEWLEDHCNSEEARLGVTSPVGLFPQGAAEGGIHDLVGNVWEWCWDWYDEDYYARSQDAHNPTGPEHGEYRVLRGGSWYDEGPSRCRCGCRSRGVPGDWDGNGGFRCVRTLSS